MKSSFLPVPPAKAAPAAFSLVEVVLAMGIVAFGITVILGLLPVGLNTVRQAMDLTSEGQIVQQISGEALVTPFTQLSDKFSGKTFYYDDEGQKTAGAQSARYWVTTTLTNPVYPGSSTAVDSYIRTIRAQVVSGASASAKGNTTNVYNIVVPNSGN